MSNTPDFELAWKRLGVVEAELGQWADDGVFFTDAGGRSAKCYDDVVLTRPVPVSDGARWVGGDAQPGCVATVIMFTMGARSIANLECYCEPDGFAFGWDETSLLQLYKTTEEKWPD